MEEASNHPEELDGSLDEREEDLNRGKGQDGDREDRSQGDQEPSLEGIGDKDRAVLEDGELNSEKQPRVAGKQWTSLRLKEILPPCRTI